MPPPARPRCSEAGGRGVMSRFAHGASRRPGGPRQGFTLAELAVGIAVVSVIIVAIGSVVMVAAKALPTAPGPTETTVTSNSAMDRIASELRYATSITEATPTSVAFTVADRDGDGQPETIRYAWSGASGAPLTREYNGSAPMPQIPG